MSTEQAPTNLFDQVSAQKKSYDIPVDHLDYKYVNQCNDVKELEKIYKTLVSGVEGKYPDLEDFVFKKISNINPNSRVLRKDAPIKSMGKSERAALDQEMNDFFQKVTEIGKTISGSANTEESESDLPPVRNQANYVLEPTKSKPVEDNIPPAKTSNSTGKAKNKRAKPRDYNEWAKIEKMIDENTDEEPETKKEQEAETKKKFEAKVVTDKTQINGGSGLNKLIKNLPKPQVKADDLDENIKELKADQEKCKGNEAYKSGCYDEALHYYTKSIQYMPTAASYNNRAMAYLKVEKWDHAIEDCSYVLKFEASNVKALLRRATGYFKKKRFADAKSDIELCLSIEENNKKALELKSDIEKAWKKDEEEKEKIKSKGGNRVMIEESDSGEDDDADVEEKLENIILNGKEKPTSIQVKDKTTGQKTSIKISEVDSEDCEETEDEEEVEPKSDENNNQLKEAKKQLDEIESLAKQLEDLESTKLEAQSEIEKLSAKIEPVKVVEETPVLVELPKNVTDFKDKANTQYASGQYADALEFYSFAIDALEKEKTSNLELDKCYKTNLSILYNNRASCKLKICDYRSSIRDCDSGLELLDSLSNLVDQGEIKSRRVKLMSKKAQAYEMLEKFKDAFFQYEELMKIDHANQNIQRDFNRVRQILKDTGEFDKIRNKKTSPLVREKSIETKQPQQANKTHLYAEYKNKGNEYVKKSEFQYAVGFYTKCVELDKENVIGYLNRALCYVKLNQAELAIQDCTFVLDRDAKNVKALYRRASANKLKKNYELVAKDLKELLSLEPNNEIAAKELKEVNSLLAKNPKKVLITEVESKPEKTVRIEPEPSKKPVEEKKPEVKKTQLPTTTAQPVKPTTFGKISNGYEFLQNWNKISPKDIDSYARLLLTINPKDLPGFIGSKLDDEMLNRIIKSVSKLTTENETNPNFSGAKYLRHLSLSKRFDVTKLFIDQEYLNMVKQIVSVKESNSAEDVEFVRKAFEI